MTDTDLVGIVEIAQRASVTRDAVHKWRERYPDFPTPLADLAATPVWRWSTIETWLRATGRLVNHENHTPHPTL